MWNTVLTQGMGFLTKRREAKNRAAWDNYHNAMAGIQAGVAQNAITDNVAINRARHAENKVAISKQRMMTAAKVKAGAAASGVAGGAVEATLFDIGRNAGQKIAGEEERMRVSLLATDQQRRGVAMQRTMSQKDVTSTPSMLSGMVGIGMTILEDRATEVSSTGTNLDGAERTSSKDFSWDRLKTLMT